MKRVGAAGGHSPAAPTVSVSHRYGFLGGGGGGGGGGLTSLAIGSLGSHLPALIKARRLLGEGFDTLTIICTPNWGLSARAFRARLL